MTASPSERLLAPATVARLARLRLTLHRRVDGRYAGGHAAQGFGASQDFVDYRDYSPGDDPRLLDPAAHARLGRRLVRLYRAEDTAGVRVVLDASASMGFGDKWTAARRVAAALVAVAAAGGDRVRVIVAGERIDLGPWYAGPGALPAAEARLARAPVASGAVDLAGALRRAHGEGVRGPVMLVSDLLVPEWPELLRLVGAGRSDALLVHLLGRGDLEPAVTGDVRLVDAESGAEVTLAASATALQRHAATRDAWLAEVTRTCGARAVAYARLLDDEPVEPLVAVDLARLRIVA